MSKVDTLIRSHPDEAILGDEPGRVRGKIQKFESMKAASLQAKMESSSRLKSTKKVTSTSEKTFFQYLGMSSNKNQATNNNSQHPSNSTTPASTPSTSLDASATNNTTKRSSSIFRRQSVSSTSSAVAQDKSRSVSRSSSVQNISKTPTKSSSRTPTPTGRATKSPARVSAPTKGQNNAIPEPSRNSSSGGSLFGFSLTSASKTDDPKPDWNSDFNLNAGDKDRESIPLIRKAPLVSKSLRSSFRVSSPDPTKKSGAQGNISKSLKGKPTEKVDVPGHTSFPAVEENFAQSNPLFIATDNSEKDGEDSTAIESPSIRGMSDARTNSPEKKRDLTLATLSSVLKQRITENMKSQNATPLYAHKYGTAGEAINAFEGSLRSSSSFNAPNTRGSFVVGKNNSVSSSSGKGTAFGSFGAGRSGKSKKGGDVDDAEAFIRSLRSQRSATGKAVKGSIEEQWLFLKSHFKMSDDDLEWLMVAKNKGAYKYAKGKHDAAEDKYFKGLYDQDDLERKKKSLQESSSDVGEIPSIIGKLSELQISNLVVDPTSLTAFDTYRGELRNCLMKLELSKGEAFIKGLFSAQAIDNFKIILSETTLPSKAVKKAKDLHTAFSEEVNKVNRMIHEAKKSCDEALDEMEKWARRTKEADEYETALLEEEAQWLEREYEDNREALETMRSYIPINISELSVNDLMAAAKERQGWFTLDLAIELKNNRLLHWVVTHKEDIAMANFLAGEKKAFFENIEALDLIEIRAIVVCLPEKFELDGDGRKNEWRSRIMARAKQMVAQAKGETVKGGWDGAKQKRNEVTLAPLKADQERRPIYFYRSKEQCLQKVKQYDDKEATLKKKSGWLSQAKIEAEEAKKEYDIILNEMRDPDLKAQYGAEQVALAKKMAKEQWSEAESKRRGLEKDVNQLKTTIASNPVSKEDFLMSMKETEEYLQLQDIVWDKPDQPPILIKGVFDKMPEVNKAERKATKFVSAEEEAAIRKNEIAALKAQKDAAAIATQNALSISQEALANDAEITLNEGPEKSEVNDLEGDRLQLVPPDDASPRTDASRSPVPEDVIVSESAKPPLRRRQSVLESMNPELLSKLNKITGTPTSDAPVPNFKRAVKKVVKEQAATVESEPKEKEIKVTKSKLLQKISGGAVDDIKTAESKPAMPSFLDQLKNKGKSPVGSDGAAKPSFLDLIKSKSKAVE